MSQKLLLPGAIVIAGGLIAVGVFFGNAETNTVPGGHEGNRIVHGERVTPSATRAEHAHIFGNREAPVTIVEFSDFECPFCARLHPTLERIVEESNGTIKWEYRHVPLPSHRNAESAAYAAECVAHLGGNEAFWDYTEVLFQNQRAYSMQYFEDEARKQGIDTALFRSCVSDDEIRERVRNDQAVATALGGRGTPFSVIVYEDGSMRPVSGALPYEQWVPLLNQ